MALHRRRRENRLLVFNWYKSHTVWVISLVLLLLLPLLVVVVVMMMLLLLLLLLDHVHELLRVMHLNRRGYRNAMCHNGRLFLHRHRAHR